MTAEFGEMVYTERGLGVPWMVSITCWGKTKGKV